MTIEALRWLPGQEVAEPGFSPCFRAPRLSVAISERRVPAGAATVPSKGSPATVTGRFAWVRRSADQSADLRVRDR
jgi:hypothetical protein